MSSFEVSGADDFLRLSKALKAAGRTHLRNDLNKAMRAAAKPLTAKTAAALDEALPSGLRGRGGRTKQTVQTRTGADPGVRVVVQYGKPAGRGFGASNARLLNRTGRVRHPVFGNRERWVETEIPGAQGWFDETLRREARTVRPMLEQALQDMAERVVREVSRTSGR